jgi:hypothetical protein
MNKDNKDKKLNAHTVGDWRASNRRGSDQNGSEQSSNQRVAQLVSDFWSDGGELAACDIARRVEDVVPAVVLGRRVLRLRMSGDVPKSHDGDTRMDAIARALPVGWSVACTLFSDVDNDTTVTRKTLWVTIDVERCSRHVLATEVIAISVLTLAIFALILLFTFRFIYIY